MQPYKILVSLALLFCVCSASALEGEKHLFILSGQSNMSRLDHNISFRPIIEAEFGAQNVIIVKDAKGGKPIRRWYKNWKPLHGTIPIATGDLYDRLMAKVSAAIQGQALSTVTFLWMQGERDAREGYGVEYASSLKGLIKQLSLGLGRSDINVVIGRLSDFAMNDKSFPHWRMVRDTQVEVAQEYARGAWVNTDDLNDLKGKENNKIINDLHYTQDGYNVFGKRLAVKAIDLIKKWN